MSWTTNGRLTQMTSYSEAKMDPDSFEPGRSSDESPVKGTPRLSASDKLRLSPSMLARKILCPAYVPRPFGASDRLKFLSFHAMAVVKVIRRHLKTGFTLLAVERGGPGYRVDLLFQSPTGTRRLTEVKAAKRLLE